MVASSYQGEGTVDGTAVHFGAYKKGYYVAHKKERIYSYTSRVIPCYYMEGAARSSVKTNSN